MLANCQSELRAKIVEFTDKFTASTGAIESSVRETIIQEAAADRIREIAAVQKKVFHMEQGVFMTRIVSSFTMLTLRFIIIL